MSIKEFQYPHQEKKWKALAFESEMISKDILSKEYLPENLWKSYREQVVRLKMRMAQLGHSPMEKTLQEKLFQIEARLKFLNPENRIQTNFEFFTKKIHYFKNRLEFLNQSLESFDNEYNNLSTIQCKRAQIEQEIANLEKSLAETHCQREALLA